MAALNFKNLFIFAWLAAISGCATQPSQPADPFAALEVFDVKFLHQPPPDAKFIAKISFSSASYDHWQEDCLRYLRTQTVKLGGNVVVPGVELELHDRNVYNDGLQMRRQLGIPDSHLHPNGATQITPDKLQFWSKVYYSPKYD